MRDGIKLFTSIYIPKNNSEEHPILLTRTPYSCAPYGEDVLERLLELLFKGISERGIYYGYTGCQGQMDE